MRLALAADRPEPLITGGLVATCATMHAEAFHRARSADEYERVRSDRRDSYEYLPTDDVHWRRAFDAQPTLAGTGRHRAVGIADLLTAVHAAEHGMTVAHYDADFEIAAEVLAFEHRRVVPEEACSRARSVCISWCPRGDLNPHAR